MIGQVLYSDEDMAVMEREAPPAMSPEDAAALQAWAALVAALELAPTASPDEVSAALIARGVAPNEVADWLPACNYDVVCFTETMHYELRQADQRRSGVRVAVALGVVAIVVFAGAGYVLYTRRR